jgi:hypothetical protein
MLALELLAQRAAARALAPAPCPPNGGMVLVVMLPGRRGHFGNRRAIDIAETVIDLKVGEGLALSRREL